MSVHRLRLLSRVRRFGAMHVFLTRVCINQLRRLLRFSSDSVTMRVLTSRVCISLIAFCVIVVITSQCMCLIRECAPFKTVFSRFNRYCLTSVCTNFKSRLLRFLVKASQCMCFTLESASFKTPFAFSWAWLHNAFSFSDRVTMRVFHTRVCIS